MARMIPAQIYSETKSPGEIEIFHRLRDDPLTNNWIVLHSLDISHHKSQIAGEVDFVIIVPGKGVLCLEVKAHLKVRREYGIWYWGTSPTPDPRGPFKQASEALHSIRERVKRNFPKLSRIVFWSAVIFPYLELSITADEWHPWQAIDSKQFRSASIGELVLNVLDNARMFLSKNPNAKWFTEKSAEPNPEQCKQLCEYLRPDFEFFESPDSRINRINTELKAYTKEQYDAIDGMDSNDRVIFSGPAGTGKTLLAIEVVRRSTNKGQKVLFCCYNRLLGTWLRDQFENILPTENVGTLHSIMLSVAGITPPDNASREFWEIELPEKAIENLLADPQSGGYKFDEIIIDEAQDLLKNTYLDFFDLILRGGLNSGKWKFFGDFEKQAIYASSSKEFDNILNNKFRSATRYNLRINCRNTPRIASLVHYLGGLNPGYSKIRRPDNQIEPQITPYKKQDQQKEKLIKIIDNLLREGVRGSEIIILSPKSDQNSIASTITNPGFTLSEFKNKKTQGEIGYCTIHSFKGLEASVVIVTDIEEIEVEKSASLFYIAITRSVERLYILVNERARVEMVKTLTEPNSEYRS
jgi:DNA polymerase III delta prime subunit